MLLALALLSFGPSAGPLQPSQDPTQVETPLAGFESMAVDYSVGGAILRAWLDEDMQALQDAFQVTDRRSEDPEGFEPLRLRRWPVAWELYFQGGARQTVWPAGPNQLHHFELGRMTVLPEFTNLLHARLEALSGARVSLRTENPMPAAWQETASQGAELLGRGWKEVSVEARGRQAVLVPHPDEELPLRLLPVVGGSPYPDGGARFVLRAEEGDELVLRLLNASRANPRVLDHAWLHVDGVGAVWVPNRWMRRWCPDWPSMQRPSEGLGRVEALTVLIQPKRLALELDSLVIETRPLRGEYGPPRLATSQAPVARLPTRVWSQLVFERQDKDEAYWRRRLLDLERRGAALIHLAGQGEEPWSFLMVPRSETSALIPYFGVVRFDEPAWTDLGEMVALDLGLDDSESVRLAPR